MTASDVMLAYGQHCRDLSAREVAALMKKGIPEDALEFDQDRGLFKLQAIGVLWEGAYFAIDGTEKAERCIAIVCRDERGEVADIAAWSPRSDKVGLHSGCVSMIGEEACMRPRLEGDKLWVREGVLDWLIHRRTGVVIINADQARAVLTAGSPVAVRSKAHRERLEAAWRSPRVQVFADDVAAVEAA